MCSPGWLHWGDVLRGAVNSQLHREVTVWAAAPSSDSASDQRGHVWRQCNLRRSRAPPEQPHWDRRSSAVPASLVWNSVSKQHPLLQPRAPLSSSSRSEPGVWVCTVPGAAALPPLCLHFLLALLRPSLPATHPRARPHGREALPLRAVREKLRPSLQPKAPLDGSYRGETLPLPTLWEAVLLLYQPEGAPERPHRGEEVPLLQVWKELLLPQQPHPAPGSAQNEVEPKPAECAINMNVVLYQGNSQPAMARLTLFLFRCWLEIDMSCPNFNSCSKNRNIAINICQVNP